MSVLNKLDEEVEQLMGKLSTMDERTDDYNTTVKHITSLTELIVQLKKVENDKLDKEANRENDLIMRNQQVKDDKVSRIIQYVLDGSKIIIPVASAFAMGIISMRWEKLDTITSTAGRNSLKDVIKFKY